MSEGFYPLTVSRVVQETTDASTFYFEIPEQLKSTFAYTAGQYLTFETEINGEKVRRSYSLCTYAGADDMPAVTVKRVEGGKMSNFMNDNLHQGAEIAVMPPMGKFTVVPDAGRSARYVLFAGGSGITPMMGIAKAVLMNEPGSTVTLVYANRNPESVIFKNAIAQMEQAYPGRFKVLHSYDKAPLTWFGLKGLFTEEKVMNLLNSKLEGSAATAHFYICGPGPMMEVVKKSLATAGVEGNRIHTEYFSAPVSSESKTEETPAEAAFNGQAQVKVSVYGKTHTIACDDKTTILNACMKNGIDPPYSCTVGVCTTCRAKVHKGNLYMMEREGLTDDEIAEGFVLTCQALPRSSDIELTYE
jgi:ring-1,2-phenylacetyl-CoA epoxidase subunit PaaE